MSFSPQQLERMLSLLDAQARPAPQAPLGVAPEHFLPEAPGESYLASSRSAVPSSSNPVGVREAAFSPPPRAISSGPPTTAVAEAPPPTIPAELPDRTPSRVADPASPPDDFSEFSGKPARQPVLPRGAKNVQCHSIERDPDSGRILKVYTYSMESPDGA